MPNSRSGPSRRSFLASAAVAAAATAGGVPLLSACGGGGSGGAEGGRVSESELESILPAYREASISVQPDIPSENGSSPGFTTFTPASELDTTVPRPLGNGGRFTVMSPLWGTAPQAGNAYWTAMDEAIGVSIDWQILDGNTYGERLSAVLAGSDIPDLVVVPGWELEGQMHQAISSRFADLGPYLSGDAVLDYPNLAAIPTAAWRSAVFGGALRGLPMPQPALGGVVPYYREDIFEANGWTQPRSAREFYDWAVDVTSPRQRVWACEDMKWTAFIMFGVLPDKPSYWELGDNGRLVNRYETEAYLEALEWARSLFEAEVVHPDAVSVTGDSMQRFAAGESLVLNTGDGSWYGTSSQQMDVHPEFRMNAFDFFAHDGGDPVLWNRNGSGIWCFLNRNLSEDRIREALQIANFCAAPYGTTENRLRLFGVEGEHYRVEDGLPVRTEAGIRDVVPDTYTFIATPAHTIAYPDLPWVVEYWTGWQQRNMPFVRDPLFLGRQIAEPPRLANLADSFEELEDDVVRGRASIRDVRNAVDEWRRNGGDELRDWYQRLLEEDDPDGDA